MARLKKKSSSFRNVWKYLWMKCRTVRRWEVRITGSLAVSGSWWESGARLTILFAEGVQGMPPQKCHSGLKIILSREVEEKVDTG